MTNIERVQEFHKTFGAPVLEKPELPSQERCLLRVDLLQEEVRELKEAFLKRDLVAVADALADIEYILLGTVLEVGMDTTYEKAFEIVHNANMSKVCKDHDELKRSIEYYRDKRGVDSAGVEQEDGTFVLKRSDGKILKSVGYQPAEPKLQKLLEEYV